MSVLQCQFKTIEYSNYILHSYSSYYCKVRNSFVYFKVLRLINGRNITALRTVNVWCFLGRNIFSSRLKFLVLVVYWWTFCKSVLKALRHYECGYRILFNSEKSKLAYWNLEHPWHRIWILPKLSSALRSFVKLFISDLSFTLPLSKYWALGCNRRDFDEAKDWNCKVGGDRLLQKEARK